MDKKRSKGVTFLGWFFIVTSLLSMLTLLSPKHYIKLQGSLYNQIEFLYFTIVPFFCLFAGIYILKLKNWARKLGILIYSVSLVFTITQFIFIGSSMQKESFREFMQEGMGLKIEAQKQEIIKKYKPEYQQEAIQNREKMSNVIIEVLPIFLYVIMSLVIVWNAFIIYFFTRPKVKEQFT
ncbi:MAG: hypothetical protein HQ579_01935 [Candidatus Omnitrophica bacterium]|nr:hypothetical protein [Candidatus Omnitrophota bacterium]